MREKIFLYVMSGSITVSCLLGSAGAEIKNFDSRIVEVFTADIARLESEGWWVRQLVLDDLGGNEKHMVALFANSPDLEGLGEPPVMLRVCVAEGDRVTPIFTREFFVAPGVTDIEVVDFNRDGSKEIVLMGGTGGSAWQGWGIFLLSVNGKEAREIDLMPPPSSGDLEHGMIPAAHLSDLDGDGICELMLLDARFELAYGLCHAASPGAYQVYRWEEDHFQEKSSAFPFYYEMVMQDIRKWWLEGVDDPDDYYVGKAISLFLNYYYKGERGKGFKELERLLLEPEMKRKWEALPGYAKVSEILRDLERECR